MAKGPSGEKAEMSPYYHFYNNMGSYRNPQASELEHMMRINSPLHGLILKNHPYIMRMPGVKK